MVPLEAHPRGYSTVVPPEIEVYPYEIRWRCVLSNLFLAARKVTRATHVVVFLPNGQTVALGVIAAIRRRPLLVYVGGEVEPWLKFASYGRIPFLRRTILWFNRVLWHRASVIACRGVHLASQVSQVNSRVVQTVPLSSIARESLCREGQEGAKADSRSLLFVGKLDANKGVDLLLRAAHVMQAEALSFTVHIVGDGPERPELERLAESLGLVGVEFSGWLDSPEELYKRYAAATLIVVPSRVSEGVPRVIDEAIELGKPVVASNVGGIPLEFAQGEIALFSNGSEKSLARTLADLLECPEKRALLVSRGARRREGFGGWRSAGEQHAALLLDGDS